MPGSYLCIVSGGTDSVVRSRREGMEVGCMVDRHDDLVRGGQGHTGQEIMDMILIWALVAISGVAVAAVGRVAAWW